MIAKPKRSSVGGASERASAMRVRVLWLVACAMPACNAAIAPTWIVRRRQPVRLCNLVMSEVDKQMSSTNLVTYDEATDDWKRLMETSIKRIDKSRVMSGKAKYETVEGMIDAYVEEAASAGLGWTRAEAESEVVRYLKRQALADEGGERSPDSVFIGIFAIIVIYSAVTGFAPAQDLPAAVISPY